jgi:hypothetical protein
MQRCVDLISALPMCARYRFCISDTSRDAKIGDMHSPGMFIFLSLALSMSSFLLFLSYYNHPSFSFISSISFFFYLFPFLLLSASSSSSPQQRTNMTVHPQRSIEAGDVYLFDFRYEEHVVEIGGDDKLLRRMPFLEKTTSRI